MFRPKLEDLSPTLPTMYSRERGLFYLAGTGWDYAERNPLVMARKVIRRISGMHEHGGIRGTTSFLPWLFRTFHMTCALFQKNDCAQ